MHDLDLIQKLHNEPEIGMRLIIEQYTALIYAVVKSKLSTPPFCAADIEHCVSDTFSEFYCDLDKYDIRHGSIRSWLCVIARNNAVDFLRSHRSTVDTLSLDDESICIPCADDSSPETFLEDQDFRTQLANAIRNLGQPDHEILVRKFYLCQSSKEIAKAMKLTVSNIDTRTHRAIKKLRTQLGGDLL